MTAHRSILAWLLVLLLGIALSAGGCASGGSDTSGGGDDGGNGDAVASDGPAEAAACSAGKTKCGTTCTSTTNDPKNCGRCGLKCATGEVCSKGTCSLTCSPPETLCGGPQEAGTGSGGDSSTGDDGGEAGSEGGDDASSSGMDATVSGDGGTVTPYCSNLNTDPANCGVCGNNCGPTGACSGGTCQLSCPTGKKPCFANNSCIPNNTCCQSGECTITGQVCPMPGGTCACPTGEKQCGGTLNSCVPSAACCTNADCTVMGQTCATPGQPCKCNAMYQCCVAGDCGPESNATGYACTANKCDITMCKAGCYDLDKSYTTGCECCEDTYGKSCAAATAAAAMTVGGAKQSFTGQIPTPTGADWFTVTFNSESNVAFHGLITLSSNPNNEFVFDVLSGSCTGSALGCTGTEGSSTAKTTWEEFYASPMPPVATPIPAVGTVFIHVYRANMTAAATCSQYVLDVSE